MDCYHFCQQYEDYFETSGARGINCTFFATTFLRSSISFRWAQHKRRHKCAGFIMWSKFKAFFRKDFVSSQAFIDSIWNKFRRDSQFQLEKARDWASYFQDLQSILLEFDLIRTLNELIMICYFREDFKPSIKVKMKKKDRESMNVEEMVQKAVKAEAKMGLRSCTIVRNSNIRDLRDHHLSHNTFLKMQIQRATTKKSRTIKSRPKEAKLINSKTATLLRSNESAKLNRKKKRRKWLKKIKNSTLGTKNNVIEDKKKRTSANTS